MTKSVTLLKNKGRGIKKEGIFTLLNSSFLLFFERLSADKRKARHNPSLGRDVLSTV